VSRVAPSCTPWVRGPRHDYRIDCQRRTADCRRLCRRRAGTGAGHGRSWTAWPTRPHRSASLATINRHGLVAGATGTGKTKSLQVIAEHLSTARVPVMMADVKGDLSGLSRPGVAGDRTAQRAKDTGDNWTPTAYPLEFLALGTSGIGVPVPATISSFGPILLSKVLGLNATQESTLGLIFHRADQQGLPLLDLKDLRSVITYLTSDEGKPELKALGAVSPTTAGVILRAGQPRGRGRRHVLRRTRVETPRPDARRPAGPRHHQSARAGQSGRATGDVLHVPDVGAGRP
jgi:hypothetical protein